MTDRQKGVIALTIVLGAWSLSNPFVKYLINEGYDPHTQNFYRYATGTLAVWPFLIHRARQRGVRLNGHTWLRLFGATLPNLSHQVFWVMALLWVYPALASFLNKSSVLFAAIMAYAFFPEERWLLRSGRYLWGLGLTVAGTIGLALLRPDLDKMDVNLGVLFVLIAAASWAVYSVSVKRVAAEIGSTVSFGIVGLFTTIVLFFLAWKWGNLGHWWKVPWHVNAIMLFSGVLCIGIAHSLYYFTLRTIGVSICSTMLLTTPFFTMFISQWLFHEKLTGLQILSGAVLLGGGALTMLAKEPSLTIARAAESADA